MSGQRMGREVSGWGVVCCLVRGGSSERVPHFLEGGSPFFVKMGDPSIWEYGKCMVCTHNIGMHTCYFRIHILLALDCFDKQVLIPKLATVDLGCIMNL